LADDGTTETAVNHMRATTPARPGRLRRIRYSFECLGWRAAMTELANGVDAPESDSEFDAQHGTDTAGSVEPGDLGIGNAESRKLAIRYLPSPLRVTTWMLDRIGIDPREYSLVDLGCGKGRVLLVAAQQPFHKIVGVEISTDLAAIARRNIARFRPSSEQVRAIAVENTDVRKFTMPPGNLLIHMYHPFDPAISAAVFARLAAIQDLPQRRVVVAYLTTPSPCRRSRRCSLRLVGYVCCVMRNRSAVGTTGSSTKALPPLRLDEAHHNSQAGPARRGFPPSIGAAI
jgi:SAM-dependent methyltransferase